MRRDQGEARINRLAHRDERGGAQPDAQHQRQDAKGAEPAVAHDLELARRVAAAGEPVGGVGEPVLVQAPGQCDPGEDGEERRRPIAEADQLRREIGKGRDRADPGAGERKRPSRIGEPPAILGRCRHRHAGKERDRGGKAGDNAAPPGRGLLGTGHRPTIADLF